MARFPMRRTTVGSRVRLLGRVVIRGTGTIHLEDDVELDGRVAPIELRVGRGAAIVLGRGTHLRGGVSIECLARIDIGPATMLGGFCKIIDSHSHPICGDRRLDAPPASIPVTIGRNCELGWRCIVLPGAQLGDSVRLLPGVVVSRRIPRGVTIGGSPPRIIQPGEL
jgi:acetyltransferase-like isoleucine patch superfamily enzyme